MGRKQRYGWEDVITPELDLCIQDGYGLEIVACDAGRKDLNPDFAHQLRERNHAGQIHDGRHLSVHWRECPRRVKVLGW